MIVLGHGGLHVDDLVGTRQCLDVLDDGMKGMNHRHGYHRDCQYSDVEKSNHRLEMMMMMIMMGLENEEVRVEGVNEANLAIAILCPKDEGCGGWYNL